MGAIASPSTRITFFVTVTWMACFGFITDWERGSLRLSSKVKVAELALKLFSRNTRMMVIMSIIGMMFRSLMVSGSASLRAKERMAFFPASRLMVALIREY